MSEKYSRKVNFLNRFIELILNLKTEIRYSGKPLCEIFRNYSCGEPLKQYIDNCVNNLKNESFGESWEKAFSDSREKTGISNEEAAAVIKFGSELGSCDIEGQISYLDHNLSIMKNYLNEAIENRKKKGKLPIILGAGLSFSAALLLM